MAHVGTSRNKSFAICFDQICNAICILVICSPWQKPLAILRHAKGMHTTLFDLDLSNEEFVGLVPFSE